jgi:proline iminopeptidase
MPAARTPKFKDDRGRVVEGSVAEAGYWTIGGIRQWVMVRGRDQTNPLLVVLHGGPGSSETAFFRSFNAPVEDAFTVVYWDQRGAGRSYRKSIPVETMTIDQFVADLDELVDALLARFGKPKVVLLGHSWGSALGTIYAQRHPEKVAVYVGVGQVADMAASEAASYAYALAEAERRGHKAAIRQLRAIGPPPHDLKALGKQRRWLTAMGGAVGPRLSLLKLIRKGLTAPEASPADLVRLIQGSTFSLKALWPQLMATDIQGDFRRFEMPVFLFLGRRDMQVVASVAAAWFDLIAAPSKQLVWFENSAHMSPFEEPELFNRLMIETVRPLSV